MPNIEHGLSITDVFNLGGFDKKSQGEYRGPHPVHGSKTGNNVKISTTENAVYCFRCQAGGDPLSWIAVKEGLITCEQMGTLHGDVAFEACKIANEKYGADIDLGDIDEEELDNRKNARKVLSKAQELTYGQLNQDKQKWNRIKKDRNLEDEDIKDVKIGFWNDTVTDALKSRFDVKALISSGLFKINCPKDDCDTSFKSIEQFNEHSHSKEESKDLLYPVIGGRITFPYRKYGNVRYFIGRRSKQQEDYWYSEAEEHKEELVELMENSDTEAETLEQAKNTWVSRKCGKYVKICETDYNEHIIWQELKDREELIITEGIYDAISAHKAGYSVASPVTTRFNSKDQKKIVEISKNFNTVHLVFDGDTAGKEGQQQTARQLTRECVEPNVVTLDAGKDLDDWTNENGYEIENLLKQGERYIATFINRYNDAEGREGVEIKESLYRTVSSWKPRRTKWIWRQMDGNKREFKKEWKNVKEEVREEKEIENQRQKLPEQKEDNGSTEITDTLSIKGTNKELHINPRPSVYVNQLEKTATKTFTNEVGTVNKEQIFKVYEVQFGEGNEENTYKLLVEPWRQLTLGENNLPIRQADLYKDKYFKSDYFREKWRTLKDEVEGFSKSYKEWMEDVEGSEYIELQDNIDNRSKNTVNNLCNDKILEMVQEYLQAGWYTDPKLRAIMYPQMIQHHKSKVKPGNIAKYQPHTQMWTNTKVGKSKTGGRVGRKIDETSTAGLLGYADTDGKQQGQIDGLEVPVFLDEFNFGQSSQQLNDKLLPLLEEGYFEQTKAGHSVKTRFYGNVSYLANPQDADLPKEDEDTIFSDYGKKEKTQFELVSQFEELIDLLGMNIQAMASRFGVIVFDEEMDRASEFEENDLTEERLEKLEAFVQWVRSKVSKEYTDIEREMKDWLNKEYDPAYETRINQLAEDTSNEKVEKFWKNHIHSYRHARGQALRMAVMQYIGDVVKEDYELSEIREEAEKQWSTVKEINMESLENMTEATDEQQEKSRARSKIDSYSPKYLRLFTKAVIKYHQENGENQIGNIKLFEDLKPVYNDLKEDLPNSDVTDNSLYWKWSELKSKVVDNLNKKRLDLSNDFGIEIFRRSGEEMFRVKTHRRFKKFYDLDIGEESTESEEKTVAGEISGDYDASTEGLMRLVSDNADSYEKSEIPESDIVNYFGRKHGGKKYADVMESLDELKSNGRIQPGSYLDEKSWMTV